MQAHRLLVESEGTIEEALQPVLTTEPEIAFAVFKDGRDAATAREQAFLSIERNADQSRIGAGPEIAVVVVGVHVPAQHDLVGVIHAVSGHRFALSPCQRRHEHCRQNGDNGNDDQQFDEGEGAKPAAKRAMPGRDGFTILQVAPLAAQR